MGLDWPNIQNVGGDMDDATRREVMGVLDEFADQARDCMARAGFQPHASPLWRPWNAIIMRDSEKVVAAFWPLQGGIAFMRWLDRAQEVHPPQALAAAVANDVGAAVSVLMSLPRPDSSNRAAAVRAAALAHVEEVERSQVLGRLGDLTGLWHLEPSLREFLSQHPNPERNVFVMMRFISSPQMDEIFTSIRTALGTRGFDAVRADDRDYTGELWSNIEVYMACSTYGIAVFEDIEKRDFNPNVSLELGYMLGRRKRCLILKEQRLPDLPADVVHRLYKPFDMFDISGSISREVGRWVDVDLGMGLRVS